MAIEIEKKILQALKEGPLYPKDLVAKLPDLREEDVRRIYWRLLDRGALTLTMDRRLRVAEVHQED